MKYILLEKCEDRYEYTNRDKDHIVERHVIIGNTLEECFKKAYPYERSLRYCNGYWTEFEDKDINSKYKEWKRTGVSIEMYYGNGTVD